MIFQPSDLINASAVDFLKELEPGRIDFKCTRGDACEGTPFSAAADCNPQIQLSDVPRHFIGDERLQTFDIPALFLSGLVFNPNNICT